MPKLFPFMQRSNFLDETSNAAILSYTVENEALFVPSTINSQGNSLVSSVRVSMTYKDLGVHRPVLEEKLRSLLPEILETLQIPAFQVSEIELQLAAHGDGAFFKTHIDTAVHGKAVTPRLISAVYYLHSTPKLFTGGNLVMHPMQFGTENDQSKEILPENNSLVVFPSFSPHEVLPVVAPNVPFKDWRFAVNCWIHKG